MLSKPKILACTDFSPESINALRAADKLRQKSSGELIILHVAEQVITGDWMMAEGVGAFYDTGIEKERLKSLNEELKKTISSLELNAKGLVLIGPVAKVIEDQTKELGIDLVVVGHKGTTQNGHPFGSIAHKVVANGAVPILVVKKDFTTEKIAALLDPHESMDHIISWAEELTFLLSSTLLAVSVFPNITSQFVRMDDYFFEREDKKNEVINGIKSRITEHLSRYLHADIRVEIGSNQKLAHTLNDILLEEQVDLIVMKRHHKKFIEKFIIGSETRRMLELHSGNIFILPPT